MASRSPAPLVRAELSWPACDGRRSIFTPDATARVQERIPTRETHSKHEFHGISQPAGTSLVQPSLVQMVQNECSRTLTLSLVNNLKALLNCTSKVRLCLGTALWSSGASFNDGGETVLNDAMKTGLQKECNDYHQIRGAQGAVFPKKKVQGRGCCLHVID